MKQMESDVIVVGGGASGLAAATAAAEKGIKVLVFEKGSTTGGTGNMGMGLFAVESRMQQDARINLTREQVFEIFMNYTHWRSDARLVRAYIDKSASTIEWLQNMGVEFTSLECQFPGAHFTVHQLKTADGKPVLGGAAVVMIKILTQKIKDLGGEIFLQTPVKKILKKNDRIAGIIAEDKNGESIQANARAVIVGTGGFGDNPEMIKKYTGYEYGRDMFNFRIPGLTGDGLRMAWEAGAAQSRMDMEVIFSLMPPFEGRGGTRIELAAFRQPNLMVNLLGERFMNEEEIRNTTYAGNAIALQKESRSFIIFDEDAKRDYEKNNVTFPEPIEVGNLDETIRNVLSQGYKHLHVADSMEDLCSKTGIDLNGLNKTVMEYNRFCEIGHDDLFNKSHRYLRPIKTPKFYAGCFVPSAYGSLGGIKINYRTEVLNKNFEVIPGLYATGVDANTLYGDSYIYILPANTLGFAINSGRMAGENAAEFVLKK